MRKSEKRQSPAVGGAKEFIEFLLTHESYFGRVATKSSNLEMEKACKIKLENIGVKVKESLKKSRVDDSLPGVYHSGKRRHDQDEHDLYMTTGTPEGRRA